MAYLSFNPANVPDAIQQIVNFLNVTMGWSASYNAGTEQGTVTIPGKTATFILGKEAKSYYDSLFGGFDYEVFTVNVTNISVPFISRCNWLNPITSCNVFANDTDGEPWCLVVFESTPGVFHHSYFGYMHKLGVYDGGAIADATWWSAYDSLNWEHYSNKKLFGGTYGISSASPRTDPPTEGGIEVVHADSVADTYYFGVLGGPQPNYCGGGFGDSYSSEMGNLPPLSLNSSVSIFPVIVCAMTDGSNSNSWVTPVGCIEGIRSINMNYFNPGEVINVGGKEWQVFPMGTKRVPRGVPLPLSDSPGNIQPDTAGNYDARLSNGTEYLGFAVLRN